MVIAFCTAVMNRRWQLQMTLGLNLARLQGTPHFLALVDYNSSDGVADLVRPFSAEIQAGTLLHFHTVQPPHYHCSRAKNLAHRLALRRQPDVLFNLDGDNMLSDRTIPLVLEALGGTGDGKEDSVLHNWSTRHGDGTFGRIALRAATWKVLGGYDETFAPASFQDVDLLHRCRAAGVRYKLESVGIPFPLHNTMAQKLANLGPAANDEDDDNARYGAMYRQNFVTSMNRPCRLPYGEQQPFRGRLNFGEEIEI
jgi:hypothetical protein